MEDIDETAWTGGVKLILKLQFLHNLRSPFVRDTSKIQHENPKPARRGILHTCN